MPSSVGYVVRGVRELNAELEKVKVRTDAGTIAGLKAMQNDAKKNIRSRMRGRPRWDRRGASERTGAEVNLDLSPHHVSKSSGPGKLDGKLYGGVGGVRRPKKFGAEYRGGVGCGGRVTNLYKRYVEQRYPFIRPGVQKTIARGDEIWARAWDKAVHK